jgi:transcriptional regulator with XRE-family HTH domain
MPAELGSLNRALTILRISRGLSQDEVAKATGLSNSALSEYERGRKTPEFKNVRKIVTALGYRLSAVDRAEDFLVELRAESVREPGEEAEALEDALASLEGEEGLLTSRPQWRKGQRVATQIGQAVSNTLLFVFELVLSRRQERS